MKIPKTLKIFGDEWKIKIVGKNKDGNNGSSFSFTKKYIEIYKGHQEIGLIHEILEAIMVKNYARYYGQENNMEYMFIMSHTDFARVAEQLAEILKENELLK
jgi:hypothetical protein